MSTTTDIRMTILSATIAAGGAFMLFRTRQAIGDAQAIHDREVADRLARGSDAYFEELRSLEAYKPTNTAWKRRVGGAALLLFGAFGLYIAFYPQ